MINLIKFNFFGQFFGMAKIHNLRVLQNFIVPNLKFNGYK
jgi:hypothetical protein